MTASLYRKYNAFSNRESAQTEQKHRTRTFVGLLEHVHVYFYYYGIMYSVLYVKCDTPREAEL